MIGRTIGLLALLAMLLSGFGSGMSMASAMRQAGPMAGPSAGTALMTSEQKMAGMPKGVVCPWHIRTGGCLGAVHAGAGCLSTYFQGTQLPGFSRVLVATVFVCDRTAGSGLLDEHGLFRPPLI